MTTAGIGVITWRASCSCRWKHAGQHPRLARVDVPAGVGLGDQALELVRRAAAPLEAHVDSEQAQDAVGDRRQHDDQRMEQHAEGLQRTGDAPRDRLGAIDRVELGDHLAGDQLRGGDDQEGDDHRDRDRHAVAERAAERALEEVGERGLAERADADRGHRDPDLDGRDVLVDVRSSCSSASAAPLTPSSRISSRRARRERTSAYSAITKNALIATRTAAKMSFRPFTPERATDQAPAAPCGRPPGRRGRRALGPTLLRGSSSSSFIGCRPA